MVKKELLTANWEKIPDCKLEVAKKSLSDGLNEAYKATKDANKKEMIAIFQSKIEDEPSKKQLIRYLKTSARVLSHHTNLLKSRSSTKKPNAYRAASSYFEVARDILCISNEDWTHVLNGKPDGNQNFDTYSSFFNCKRSPRIPSQKKSKSYYKR